MSPAKFGVDEAAKKREINGARPSPLKINKESHIVHKPSSYSKSSTLRNSSSFPSSSSYALAGDGAKVHLSDHKQQQKQPVIIYTQTPKVIHTQACDFMVLVQKLTGYSRSDDDKESAPPQPKNYDHVQKPIIRDEKLLPPLMQMNGGHGSDVDVKLSPRLISQIPAPPNSYLRDIPLFTPTPMNLFYSPHPISYVSPDANDSISPSLREFLTQLPEY